MGFWESVKRGWNTRAGDAPAPGSVAAEQAARQTPMPVALSASEALDAATVHMLARGYSVAQRTNRSVSFVGHEGPNIGIGCLLLLLAIIPGLIYLALAGRDTHVTLLASPREGAEVANGCTLLIGGDNWPDEDELRAWANALPKPA